MKKNYEVGYGKPPEEHRFKKGKSGNPGGRPPRKPADPEESSLRAILERTAAKTVKVGGESRSLIELEIQSLQHKAAKGDVSASRHLSKLRTEAGLSNPTPVSRGGVLVVPAPMSFDEWGAKAAASQAKFRGEDPEGLARLTGEAPGEEPESD